MVLGFKYLQNKSVALRGRKYQSDFAGRIMRGNWGPLSWSEVKKGRATINDFLVIWAGGTASSKSNDRTKANNIAFILIVFASVNDASKRVIAIAMRRKAHSVTANR